MPSADSSPHILPRNLPPHGSNRHEGGPCDLTRPLGRTLAKPLAVDRPSSARGQDANASIVNGSERMRGQRGGWIARRLLSESVIYGFGGVANQALSVLLVPLYARQLGVADYGILAILITTQSLTTMIVGLALPQAFFRSYLKEASGPAERARVLHTSVMLRAGISTAGLAVFSLLAFPLATLLGEPDRAAVVLLIGPIAFLDSLNTLPLSFLRAERRASAYATLAFVRAGLALVAIIVLVVVLGMGIAGVLIGSLIAAAFATSIGVGMIVRVSDWRWGWDGALVRHMLSFSLPLVPAALAGWALSLSDRYVIQAVDGNTAVGIYAGGYTIGLAVSALIVQPFGLTWGAAYWELAREEHAQRLFARVLTAFTVVTSFIALILSALATDIIRIVLTPAFDPGRWVVPFAAFAYVCYGIYSILGTGLNLESQTRWLPLTIGVPAAVNVVLNLVLIPRVGFMGAAFSTLLCYALLAVLTGIAAHRYYPVPWEVRPTLAALVLGFALAELALAGPDVVIWRLACIVLYLPLLLLARVIRRSDVGLVRSALGRGT